MFDVPIESTPVVIPNVTKTSVRWSNADEFVGTTTAFEIQIHGPCNIEPGADYLLVRAKKKEKP
jgi:hypothetical protein